MREATKAEPEVRFATCAYCKATYVLTEEELGTRGKRVKCAVCNNEWFQSPAKLHRLYDGYELVPYNETRLSQFAREGNAPQRRPRPKQQDATNTLFVANMPFAANEADVAAFFESVVDNPRVTIVRDNLGRSKGFGFVACSDVDAARAAVEQLNNADFQGRKLVVNFGKTREERAADASPE